MIDDGNNKLKNIDFISYSSPNNVLGFWNHLNLSCSISIRQKEES